MTFWEGLFISISVFVFIFGPLLIPIGLGKIDAADDNDKREALRGAAFVLLGLAIMVTPAFLFYLIA